MDTKKNIVIGEWFCPLEGIAIAERIHDFYYEEFEDIPEGKKVGDYLLSVVEYKLFCDYEGKPIRRNRFKYFNKAWCSSLDEESKIVLNNSIKSYPKEYESFLKFLKVPKYTYETYMVFYEVTEDNKLQVAQDMENIQKSLPEKFTYEDVIRIGEEYHCVINLKQHIENGHRTPIYLRVMMGFTNGDFKGKRVLFDRFIYEICEIHR